MKINFDGLRTQRKWLRILFTLISNKIESELAEEVNDFLEHSVLKIQFIGKFQKLDIYHDQHSEILLVSSEGEKLFAEDFEAAELTEINIEKYAVVLIKQYKSVCLQAKVKEKV